MKIACIGNYVPRQCGIATFTRDLVESLVDNNIEKNIKADAFVVAMNDEPQNYDYPEIVTHTVRQNHQRDYLNAVKYINLSGADICILQHEFGIFGGDDGLYILSMVQRLGIPLVVTFHTILKKPSYNQKIILQGITKKAEKVVVMSNLAVDFLKKIYKVPEEKIALIEHGVPDFSYMDRSKYKKMLNLENRKSLMTFGLLSKDKGIETVIKALPPVVEKHPELLYILLGKTHPAVVRVSGEEYRNYLKRMVDKLFLTDHVYFYDHYATNEELFSYLTSIDLYITPYLNKAQITSGTLSYAVGAGAAVVSTPYWHARELLSDDRGRLYDFGDSKALTGILLELFGSHRQLEQLRKKASDFGCKTLWPEIGARYLKLIAPVTKPKVDVETKNGFIIDPSLLPKFRLEQVKRLTDSTGILQHAKYGVPNFKEGYTLDDNVRALIMALMAYRQKKSPEALELIPVYLGFINYMQNEDGTFKNFLTYSRMYMEEKGSEDSFGRAVWALGYTLRFPPRDAYRQLAADLFSRSFPNFEKITSLRGISYTIIGICHYLHRFPNDEGMKKVLKQMTQKIIKRYDREKDGNWHWFEAKMTYANGIIPLALFHSLEMLEDEKTLAVAKESMDFLERLMLRQGYLTLVGNENWYEKGGTPSQYAQQPIDAMVLVLLAYQAYVVTKDAIYLYVMSAYFMWFLGENDLGIPVYDFETAGCFDGLEQYGLNQNQGAESTLAYLIAHLTVLLAHE
ncbi:MAG: glycosyltransferase [bacterium]|nr:glycosyltransferase [bacterium]